MAHKSRWMRLLQYWPLMFRRTHTNFIKAERQASSLGAMRITVAYRRLHMAALRYWRHSESYTDRVGMNPTVTPQGDELMGLLESGRGI